MANKHINVDEEFKVNLDLTIKLKSISDYHGFSDSELKFVVDQFKREVSDHLKNKLTGDHFDEVTDSADYFSYEID